MALQLQGAAVSVFDPRAAGPAALLFPTLAFAATVEEVLDGSDVTLHLTEWPEFAELDAARLIKVVRGPRLLDARNTLDPLTWRDAGWTFRAIGRPNCASGPHHNPSP
jgi:UDPglucose 6-dehydrogenase